jgi:hypothetical protein
VLQIHVQMMESREATLTKSVIGTDQIMTGGLATLNERPVCSAAHHRTRLRCMRHWDLKTIFCIIEFLTETLLHSMSTWISTPILPHFRVRLDIHSIATLRIYDLLGINRLIALIRASIQTLPVIRRSSMMHSRQTEPNIRRVAKAVAQTPLFTGSTNCD